MSGYTSHIDTFAGDNLPDQSQQPVFLLDRPEFQYPEKMNCATELLDDAVRKGWGGRIVLRTPNETWTYRDLLLRSNRIAQVLVHDLGVKPGNRVLIRAANNPMFVACWFAIAKVGGIVVATMPMLRGKEISVILDKAQIEFALCDERLAEDMEDAQKLAPVCKRICYFNGSGEPGASAELESLMARQPTEFVNVDTARDDTVLIAFTSGTTGTPKGTMHYHRDIMAMCDAFPQSTLKPTADDVFIGSPPIAFTFGLGGLVVFPMRYGASTVMLEMASPPVLLSSIQEFGATICFTAPTAYRVMTDMLPDYYIPTLKKCVSAGETLPLPIYEGWRRATGIKLIDGLGATELIHIFIATSGDDIRPGATGKPIPGYEAKVVDEDMNEVPVGEVGRLAVRGPTGCRYLADDRQAVYVRDGWNLTGDAYSMDEDGYFWFAARADDMIISSGYNISGPEVEAALLDHEWVMECAVVGAPDPERGHIVKAFVKLRPGADENSETIKTLQDFVKNTIAPYKYPRAVEFVENLPKTETGKVQRFKLRESEKA